MRAAFAFTGSAHVTLFTLALGLLLSACSNLSGETDKSRAIVRSEIINANAPYPQSHASTLVEAADGTLIASWFGGLHERHAEVAIWVSHYVAGTWTDALKVADGRQPDGRYLPTWNPVLFQPPAGKLYLFYKVGPNPREWWGVYRTSADGGFSWSEEQSLPEGFLGPIKNKPLVTSHGGWLLPSSTEDSDGWFLHFELSSDQGKTWTRSQKVDKGPNLDAIQPSVLTHADGRLQAVARTKQGVIASSWSSDRGKTWSPVAAIDLPNPSSGTDAVTLQDGRQLIAYNHSAHQPETPGKGPRYPLNLAVSDDGLHWQPVLTLEAEPLLEGYAYPAIIQTRDGLVHVTYTVGRQYIKHMVIDPRRL